MRLFAHFSVRLEVVRLLMLFHIYFCSVLLQLHFGYPRVVGFGGHGERRRFWPEVVTGDDESPCCMNFTDFSVWHLFVMFLRSLCEIFNDFELIDYFSY